MDQIEALTVLGLENLTNKMKEKCPHCGYEEEFDCNGRCEQCGYPYVIDDDVGRIGYGKIENQLHEKNRTKKESKERNKKNSR